MGLCKYRDKDCPVRHIPVTWERQPCDECPTENCDRDGCWGEGDCSDCELPCDDCKDEGFIWKVKNKHDMVRCPVHSDKEQK